MLVLGIALAGCGGNTALSPADLAQATGGGGDMALPGGDGGGGDLAVRPSTSPSPSPGTGCGTCPSGSTCGSANGIAVCRTSTGIPLFSNVFVITMENTSWSSLMSNTSTPYLHSLIMSAGYSTNYHGVTHPSLPNSLAMTSGSPGVQSDGTTAIACDCDPVGSTCNNCSTVSTLFSSCGCEQMAQHLGDQLDVVHKKWRNYGDEMGTACNLTTAGNYATRHLPFLYYDNVQKDPGTRCADHVVDYAADFATDLASGSWAVSFIAPSLAHDMHGTGLVQTASDVTAGDSWLSTNVGSITSSAAYKAGGIVFITWDEDDLSGTLAADDPIPFFVLSPYAKSGGFSSAVHVDHYALLATIEDAMGVARLGGAVGATPLGDFFPAN